MLVETQSWFFTCSFGECNRWTPSFTSSSKPFTDSVGLNARSIFLFAWQNMLKVHVLTTEKLRKSTHQAGRLCKMSATVHKIPKHSRASLCHQDSVFHRISILVFSKHARTTLRKSHLDWLSSHKGCCCLSNKKPHKTTSLPSIEYFMFYLFHWKSQVPSWWPSLCPHTSAGPCRPGPMPHLPVGLAPRPPGGPLRPVAHTRDLTQCYVHSQFWIPANSKSPQREERIRRNKHPFKVCLSEIFFWKCTVAFHSKKKPFICRPAEGRRPGSLPSEYLSLFTSFIGHLQALLLETWIFTHSPIIKSMTVSYQRLH